MNIELGFETIGNATCTVFDSGKSILSTDPWVIGNPYFGSWHHSYEIPRNQRENIFSSKYIWISHGHPDHLDIESLKQLKKATLLIPDHYGNRIYDDLNEQGFNLKIVKSEEQIQLSKNISIKSFSDWNQDAALIIDIAGKDVLLNINDGSTLGTYLTILKEISKYPNKFLLKLIGSVEADMVNIYDKDGNFLNDSLLKKNHNIGANYSFYMRKYDCNYAIPFSNHHQYQREDSVHMNKYIQPLANHYKGFNKSAGQILPAFIKWDSIKSEFEEIKPKKIKEKLLPSSLFGDNWSDNLDNGDKKLINDYFNKIQLLKKIGKIHFDCGGLIHTISISKSNNEIIFKVPRNSLIKSIRYRIFDDLLIGNFMKTTLINFENLYPNFNPIIPKYYDNGKVHNNHELKRYFRYYQNNISASYYSFQKDIIISKTRREIVNISNKLNIYKIARYLYRLFS